MERGWWLFLFVIFLVDGKKEKYFSPRDYRVLCIAESTPSIYKRLVENDCNELSSKLKGKSIGGGGKVNNNDGEYGWIVNVSTILFNFFSPPNTTQTLLDYIIMYNPDMVIMSNILLVQPTKMIAPIYPNVWFLMSRIGSKMMNDPIQSGNIMSLEFYEHVPWFLKGVLASKFSKTISTTNDFIMHVPTISGSLLFPMLTNFYYAGLKYANPDANLTIIAHGTFGRDAEEIVNLATRISPTFNVFAHYGSQNYYTGNLTSIGKYEIANVLSINSPKEDYDILENNITTLAFTILDMPVYWEKIIIDGIHQKENNRINNQFNLRRFDVILGGSTISKISPILVPNRIKKIINLLEKKYNNGIFVSNNSENDRNVERMNTFPSFSKLFCEPFIYRIMREFYQIPNNCLDPSLLLGELLLHPKINIYNF